MTYSSSEVMILDCLLLESGSPDACEEQLRIAVSCSADDQAADQAMDDNAFGGKANTALPAAVSERQCM